MAKVKIPPEKNVDNYLHSKSLVVHKTFWPVLVDPEVHLTKCRDKLLEADTQLKKKKDFYEKQKVILNQQWKEIETEGLTLQKNFVSFNSFLLANMEKKARAQNQIEDLRRFRLDKEEIIDKLEKKMAKLKESKREMDTSVASFRIYENYLGDVLEQAGTEEKFKNINDIVLHFEYYVELANTFAEKQASEFKFLQNAKNELNKYIETNTKHVVGLHTQMAVLHTRLDEAVKKSHQLEILVRDVQAKCKEKYVDTQLAKAGAWNLYLLMCRKSGVRPSAAKNDFTTQLLSINRSLKKIHTLNEECQQYFKKIAMGKRPKK